MRRLLLRRLGQLVIVLLLVSFLTLLMLRLLPVDPAYAIYGQNATKAQVAQVHHQLGLDQPILVQYGHWLGQVLTGNLGTSLRTGQTVTSALATTLPITLEIVIIAELIALAVAIPLGVYSAYRADGKLDRTVSAASSGMVAIPGFVLALVLVYFFAYTWRIFPATGWVSLTTDPVENLRHVVLPAVTLAAVEAAVFTRVLRSDVYSTLRENFVLAARAQGMPTGNVLWRTAFRPSSLSLTTLAGVSLGRLIGATVLVEIIFSLPGAGQLLVQSIFANDIVMVQGVVIVLVAGVVIINFLVDLLHLYLDPRLRAA